jgi:hypothetical protein
MREEGEHEGEHSEQAEATEEFRRRGREDAGEAWGRTVQVTERKTDAGQHSHIRLRAVEQTSPRL